MVPPTVKARTRQAVVSVTQHDAGAVDDEYPRPLHVGRRRVGAVAGRAGRAVDGHRVDGAVGR